MAASRPNWYKVGWRKARGSQPPDRRSARPPTEPDLRDSPLSCQSLGARRGIVRSLPPIGSKWTMVEGCRHEQAMVVRPVRPASASGTGAFALSGSGRRHEPCDTRVASLCSEPHAQVPPAFVARAGHRGLSPWRRDEWRTYTSQAPVLRHRDWFRDRRPGCPVDHVYVRRRLCPEAIGRRARHPSSFLQCLQRDVLARVKHPPDTRNSPGA